MEEAKHELTAEDRKVLKKIEEGEMEEAIEEPKRNMDEKYSYYYSLKYDVDPDNGLIYKDYDLISKQRKMIFTLLKQIGGNILSGKSIMNVSFSVNIFEPCTLLDRFAGLYGYVPSLLPPIIELEDPLEKMKAVLTWVVATMHLGIGQYKPFNPVLGETLQAKVGGMSLYGEQVSHHPPISSFLVIGKDIEVSSTHGIVAQTYPNSAKAKTDGKRAIKIGGTHPVEYEITHPHAELAGLMFGKRTFKYAGHITVQDKTNELYAILFINPNKQGFFSSFFTKKPHRDDFIKGFVTKNKNLIEHPKESSLKKKKHLSICEGYWIDRFSIDGEVTWTIDGVQPDPILSQYKKLPSDSSLRLDVKALRNKDEKEAQRLKEELEDAQRNDRKLRESAKKVKH
jgi:hypothetical protein